MAFIRTIPENQASAELSQMYAEDQEALGYIPNYSRIFCHRPQVMGGWSKLLGSIRGQMDPRRYELVTIAAARALKSSYCMLAHGTILRKRFYTPQQLTLIARKDHTADLTNAEIAMMAFAEQIVMDATAITQNDIDGLREHGFSEAEIFDIAAAASARCFFSKLLDALGAEPDDRYLELDEELRQALTVGRPIGGKPIV